MLVVAAAVRDDRDLEAEVLQEAHDVGEARVDVGSPPPIRITERRPRSAIVLERGAQRLVVVRDAAC